MQETWVQSLGQEIPWKRKWQPALVFLPGKSHGQRSLAGYSPWGHKRIGHDLVTTAKYLKPLNLEQFVADTKVTHSPFFPINYLSLQGETFNLSGSLFYFQPNNVETFSPM